MKKIFFLYCITIAFVNFSCNSTKDKGTTDARFKNGINIAAKDFAVQKAYLELEDRSPVAEDNKVSVRQKVNLQLVIDSGWITDSGRIYPGVYQKIESNDGKHVFEIADLLASHPEGVLPEDGHLVTIQAVINSIDKHYDYFLVSFQVWDKRGKGEITGSYKLHAD